MKMELIFKMSKLRALSRSSIINPMRSYSTLLISSRTMDDVIFPVYEYETDLLNFGRSEGYLISFNGTILVKFPAREYFRRVLILFSLLTDNSDELSHQKTNSIIEELYKRNKLRPFEMQIELDKEKSSNYWKNSAESWEKLSFIQKKERMEVSKIKTLKNYEYIFDRICNKNTGLQVDIGILSREIGLNLPIAFFIDFLWYYDYILKNKVFHIEDISVLNHSKRIIENEFTYTTLDLGKFFIYKEQIIYFIVKLIHKIAYFGDEKTEETNFTDYMNAEVIAKLQPYLEIFLINLRDLANELPSIGLSFYQTIKFYITIIKETKILKKIRPWIIKTLFFEIINKIYLLLYLHIFYLYFSISY